MAVNPPGLYCLGSFVDPNTPRGLICLGDLSKVCVWKAHDNLWMNVSPVVFIFSAAGLLLMLELND